MSKEELDRLLLSFEKRIADEKEKKEEIIWAHICLRNGRIIPHPSIVCSFCMGRPDGGLDVYMTSEEIKWYNKSKEKKQ